MVKVEIYIASDEQVEPPIAIIVAEGTARGPSAERDPGLFGNVSESAVVIVPVETILSEVRHVDVRPAVVIEIADAHALSPPLVSHARLLRDVGEGAIAIIMVERGAWRFRLAAQCLERRAVDEVDVEPAVVII